MATLKILVWFISLYASIRLVFVFVGLRRALEMFPEGRRWWVFPAQLGSLALFAALILIHPF